MQTILLSMKLICGGRYLDFERKRDKYRTRNSKRVVDIDLNKSAWSNLGRGPRRGALAHVGPRPKGPFGYSGAPQKYPSPWTDPQTPLPASSLDPSDLWCQTASGSDPLLSTIPWTDRTFTGKFDDYRPLRSESDVA